MRRYTRTLSAQHLGASGRSGRTFARSASQESSLCAQSSGVARHSASRPPREGGVAAAPSHKALHGPIVRRHALGEALFRATSGHDPAAQRPRSVAPIRTWRRPSNDRRAAQRPVSLRARVELLTSLFVCHDLGILRGVWTQRGYTPAQIDALSLGALAVFLQARLDPAKTSVLIARTQDAERSRRNHTTAAMQHQYLVVAPAEAADKDPRGRASPCVLVDLLYKELFSCARPSVAYARQLSQAPAVMVMGPLDVEYMVRQLCSAMRDSLDSVGLRMPPWRRAENMLRSWRDVDLELFDEDEYLEGLGM